MRNWVGVVVRAGQLTPNKKPTAKTAGGPRNLPKWQTKKFMLVLDSADTKCRMIASRSKIPNDHETKKFGLALDK